MSSDFGKSRRFTFSGCSTRPTFRTVPSRASRHALPPSCLTPAGSASSPERILLRAQGRRAVVPISKKGSPIRLLTFNTFWRSWTSPRAPPSRSRHSPGLRLSEIRGLQWSDYDGTELVVRRSVWRTHTGETKTPESKAAVPVINPLRKMLDVHRRKNGASGWVFAGEKKHFALNLDNLARRSIIPKVGDRWHGWHGWRRGPCDDLVRPGCRPGDRVRRFCGTRIPRGAGAGTTSCWNRASRGAKPCGSWSHLWPKRGPAEIAKSANPRVNIAPS